MSMPKVCGVVTQTEVILCQACGGADCISHRLTYAKNKSRRVFATVLVGLVCSHTRKVKVENIDLET